MIWCPAIVQWLDPDRIPSQQDTILPQVQDREGKDAVQLGGALRSLLFVEMNNNFGIRAGTKIVSLSLKPCSQFGEIIDFAIEDEPDTLILVTHRLSARRRNVNDGKAVVA